MKKVRHFIILCFLLSFSSLFAQEENTYKGDTASFPYWIDMMQDPNANLHQTVRAFDIYWKDREITKGCGYKPFMRWAWEMKDRVNPDGSRINEPYQVRENFAAFKATQKVQKNSRNASWTNIGPILRPASSPYSSGPSGNGRVNAIAFHPTDVNKILVGTPAGGLWISDDNGANWLPMTDQLPSLGVSAIVVDRENPNRIWIGTGDRDADDAKGTGVMVSEDYGVNFVPAIEGMTATSTVARMIQDPNDANVIFAATTSGFYRSENKGQVWERTASGSCWDVVFQPGNSDVVYIAKSGSFYKSTDNGLNFTKITTGISGSRAVIGVSPADPNVVYIMTGSSSNGGGFSGFSRSSDAGETWTKSTGVPNIMGWKCTGSDTGGQAWYDLALAVDPTDANIVYTGGVNIWRTMDGGSSWNIRAHWTGACGVDAVHADQHVFEFNDLNNRFYVGNDGGVYYSDNQGVDFTDITDGLAISQIYKFGQSRNIRDKVICGFQDNGSSIYDGEGFTSVLGGDGMNCIVDHQDDTYSYGSIYYGTITRLKNMNSESVITGSIDDKGAWVTPYVLDEFDPTTMYIGMNYLWIGTNVRGNPSWSKHSLPIPSKVLQIEHSPADADILYAYSSLSKLYRCNNIQQKEGLDWERVDNNFPKRSTVNDIECHPTLGKTVYVATSKYIYKSNDGGATWEDITFNLPAVLFRTVEFYKGSSDGLYVGTDAGVYYKDAAMSEWILYDNGLPTTASVRDLEIFYDLEGDATKDLVRIATYGRGVWEVPAYRYAPIAGFTANEVNPNANCMVDFISECGGAPYTYEWTFEGGVPATSAEINPTNIKYNVPGVYKVKLKVTNDLGNDEIEKESFITVSDAVATIPNFTLSKKVICANEQISFFDLTENCPQSWEWSATPNTIEFVEGTTAGSQNPIIKFLEIGHYDIVLKSTNDAGTETLTEKSLVNVGGMSLPFYEDWNEYPKLEQVWTIEKDGDNEKDKGAWKPTRTKGPDGEYSIAMFMSNYKDGYHKSRYRLISPNLNLVGYEKVKLTFDYAYEQRFSVQDSLIIKVSTDCGLTWKRVFAAAEDGEGSFATAKYTSGDFYPKKAEDWCGQGYGANCIEIDLSEFIGSEFVKIAFEDYCKRGNNMFIDNVKVESPNSLDEFVDQNKLSVSPNPANTVVKVLLENGAGSMVQLINSNGQVVRQAEMRSNTEKINVENLPAGVYLMQVVGGEESQTEKLIIQ